jgi:exonuclease VII small subunit
VEPEELEAELKKLKRRTGKLEKRVAALEAGILELQTPFASFKQAAQMLGIHVPEEAEREA